MVLMYQFNVRRWEPVLMLSFWPNIYERRHYQRKKKLQCGLILLNAQKMRVFLFCYTQDVYISECIFWACRRMGYEPSWETERENRLIDWLLLSLLLPQQSVCFSHTFLHIRLSDSKKVSSADTYSARFTQHKSQFIMLQHHTKNSSCFIR